MTEPIDRADITPEQLQGLRRQLAAVNKQARRLMVALLTVFGFSALLGILGYWHTIQQANQASANSHSCDAKTLRWGTKANGGIELTPFELAAALNQAGDNLEPADFSKAVAEVLVKNRLRDDTSKLPMAAQIALANQIAAVMPTTKLPNGLGKAANGPVSLKIAVTEDELTRMVTAVTKLADNDSLAPFNNLDTFALDLQKGLVPVYDGDKNNDPASAEAVIEAAQGNLELGAKTAAFSFFMPICPIKATVKQDSTSTTDFEASFGGSLTKLESVSLRAKNNSGLTLGIGFSNTVFNEETGRGSTIVTATFTATKTAAAGTFEILAYNGDEELGVIGTVAVGEKRVVVITNRPNDDDSDPVPVKTPSVRERLCKGANPPPLCNTKF